MQVLTWFSRMRRRVETQGIDHSLGYFAEQYRKNHGLLNGSQVTFFFLNNGRLRTEPEPPFAKKAAFDRNNRSKVRYGAGNHILE